MLLREHSLTVSALHSSNLSKFGQCATDFHSSTGEINSRATASIPVLKTHFNGGSSWDYLRNLNRVHRVNCQSSNFLKKKFPSPKRKQRESESRRKFDFVCFPPPRPACRLSGCRNPSGLSWRCGDEDEGVLLYGDNGE